MSEDRKNDTGANESSDASCGCCGGGGTSPVKSLFIILFAVLIAGAVVATISKKGGLCGTGPEGATCPVAPSGAGGGTGKGMDASCDKCPAMPVKEKPVMKGVVAEVTNAGRFTYMRLTCADGEKWVAIPETIVKVGEEVGVLDATPMPQFSVPEMNRTFETMHVAVGLEGPDRGRVRRTSPATCTAVGGPAEGMMSPHMSPGTDASAGQMAQPVGMFYGLVKETMDASGYTYVLVWDGSNEANQVWAAAPLFSVSKGDRVEVQVEMQMQNFHSKKLDRTFDQLYMAPEIKVLEEAK